MLSFNRLLHSLLFFTFPLLLFSQITEEIFRSGIAYRNLGPANQGGRITDIEADPNDFTKVYIAVASGGVWKSTNAGTTWTPIFDNYETASIGDIALDPGDVNTIWVGTGEANNRNSVSWGNGIYKSTDGGQTFVNKGLQSTHQIARVLVHPDRSDEVCVCAIGHLWGYSGERGLFHSTNGGDTWTKLSNGLPNNGKTGCTDLIRDPQNPDILYAAFYHRLRQPWHFHSGGDHGGIFKSTDGGQSWKPLTNGLPEGPTGRIGLAIYEKNPNILMAIIETKQTDTLAIPGSGVYRSENGGDSWTYVNTYNKRPFYYSQIRINPADDQRVYVLTTQFMVSEDGGKTFRNGSEDQEVHGDFHALFVDTQYPDRYYLGADKGLSITHDHGQHFTLIDNLPIAQYYRIGFDMRDPYYIYGGLQDNGSYATASFSRDARGILSDSNWKMHWGDGQDVAANPTDHTDMYTSMENGSFFKYNPDTRRIRRISPNAFNTINHWDYFDEDEKDKQSANRYNWSAPLVMSPHDPRTVYVAGNHLYVSNDQGGSWTILSPDLSTNDPEKRIVGNSGGITPDNTGAETHCTITSIAPSAILQDLIWIGTDDGRIHYTLDHGKNWKEVGMHMAGVPKESWVSRVEASKFDAGIAYVSFDGHRNDDFETYLFRTDDYGQSWQKITKGFDKGETIRVIREDARNKHLLFAGTETGVWFSTNRGDSWARLKLNMPTVSVYDIKIHPRENDLIIGTHGRSLWVLDDISPLQELAGRVVDEQLLLFEQPVGTLWENKSRGGQRGHFWFAGDNPQTIKNTSSVPRAAFRNQVAITYGVGDQIKDSIVLEIIDPKGGRKQSITLASEPGIHRYYWDRAFEGRAFTEEELLELDETLQMVNREINNGRVRRIYKAFKGMKSSDKIRELIEPLTGGYLSFDFDEKFLIPRAMEGSYRLSIRSGDHKAQTILRIRRDPILDDNN